MKHLILRRQQCNNVTCPWFLIPYNIHCLAWHSVCTADKYLIVRASRCLGERQMTFALSQPALLHYTVLLNKEVYTGLFHWQDGTLLSKTKFVEATYQALRRSLMLHPQCPQRYICFYLLL